MKKNLVIAACLGGFLSLGTLHAKADVNQKVLKSFHSVFAKATNVLWTEYPHYYYVSFNEDDMLVKAYYDQYGNIISSIRYYKEQRLPLNILYKIRKAYPSKTIEVVTEVSNEDGLAYLIQLKDSKGWIILKSDESGNCEVTDKFQKPE